MAAVDAFPGPSGKSDSVEIRKVLAGIVTRNADGTARPGIFSDGKTTLVTARTDASWNVARFNGCSVRSGLGPQFMANDGVDQVPWAAPPASNSRRDVLYQIQRETASPFGDADNNVAWGWHLGNPSGSPQRNPLPLPDGALEIGEAVVPAGATATNSSGVTFTHTFQWTSTTGSPVHFRTVAEMKAWTIAGVGQTASIVGRNGVWRWDGLLWIPDFSIVGLYSWRANIGHQGSETPFSSITPTVRANSDAFAAELFTIGPGGWTAKFDMFVRLSFAAYNAIGAAKQSLNGRSFWRFKLAGAPEQLLGYDSRYETEISVVSNIIRIPKGTQLSANAYQDTIGTTVTMVCDPAITYLGPA